jgi:hypothetical protein
MSAVRCMAEMRCAMIMLVSICAAMMSGGAGLIGEPAEHTFSRCGVSSTIELSGTSRRS